jgi:hypothetical protein
MLSSSKSFCLVTFTLHIDYSVYSRELIPEGTTGGLVIFQDRPNYWDAWGSYTANVYPVLLTDLSQDVEIHHLETAKPLEFSNICVVSQGPLRASVRAEVRYGQSTVSVTVSFVIREHMGFVLRGSHRSRWMRPLVRPSTFGPYSISFQFRSSYGQGKLSIPLQF